MLFTLLLLRAPHPSSSFLQFPQLLVQPGRDRL
ncbi:rCG57534 [Rattus norvegicus]|uniref:RCG57534 n=1 Tax=Rattus norvegicus TaxID=10116 RepID=A6JHB7_RAT|nr:rCG57534 [Rattus norvegicus]